MAKDINEFLEMMNSAERIDDESVRVGRAAGEPGDPVARAVALSAELTLEYIAAYHRWANEDATSS